MVGCTDQEVTAIERPGSTGRRAFLASGIRLGLATLGVGTGLTACSADPLPGPDRPDSSATRPPAPTPTPLPGTVEAAARETELVIFASRALHRFRGRLTTAQRHLLTGLRDAHRIHVAALGSADPFGPDAPTAAPTSPASATPSATPTASPTGTPTANATQGVPDPGRTPKAALAKLHRLESQAAKAYRELVRSVEGPDDHRTQLVLLWGSLATAASCYAAACRSAADPGPSPAGDRRRNVIIPDQQTAETNLLEQCYAIIFGYQAAIAPLTGDSTAAAQSRLAGYRELRDRLATDLGDRHARVPAAQAAYRLPVQPTSAARAARLIAIMETRMLPYLGQWLATTDPSDRPAALSTMISTAESAAAWSPKVTVWPGYPAS
jgi:hypothetical protein